MPTSDIGRWLESHGLGKHAGVFTANELELGDLSELTEWDIDQLGLPLGPRRRLQKAIRALREEHLGERGGTAPRPGGERLQVRIGIATGQVVVGDIIGEGASQERAALGETPNVAARLQALAQPDWIVIGASTERLVAGRFELEALGPQRLKGIEAAVPAFRVAGAIATESRFLGRSRGQGGAFIGRDDEQSLLLGRWRRSRTPRCSRRTRRRSRLPGRTSSSGARVRSCARSRGIGPSPLRRRSGR